MSKPTLLLFAGYGWAASTPLYYTLAQSKYCLSPVKKEPHYLAQVFYPYMNTWKNSLQRIPDLAIKPEEWKIPISNLEYYDTNKTLDKYVELLKEGQEVIRGSYAAISDFSVSNSMLPQYIPQLLPLSEHLDIKVLQLTRDPIRRAYSQYTSKKCNHTWETCIKQSEKYYSDYLKWSSHFPTHTVKMEALWDTNTKNELERLSEFLNYNISELYPNVYSNNPPTDTTYLIDQVMTDDPPLGQGKYKLFRVKYSYLYDKW